MELAFLSPSPMELMFIAVLALIVLGPKRLPEVARSVGRGMREMRESFQGAALDDEDEEEDGDDPRWRPGEDEETDGPEDTGIEAPGVEEEDDLAEDEDAPAKGVGAPDRG